MAKHKHSRLRIFDQIRQPAPPPGPEQAGLQAFSSGDLQRAITLWSSIPNPSAAITAALAEAYFRRALLAREPTARRADLTQAARLLPDDLRFTYLLGVEFHREGNPEQAVALYRRVLHADPAWAGAGNLLALASLRLNPDADLATLPGSTPEIRGRLGPVQALLLGEAPRRGRPANGDGRDARAPGVLHGDAHAPGLPQGVARSPGLPRSDGPDTALDRLWQGLALIGAGDGAARAVLEDNRPLAGARAGLVRRYYRGVAAAQSGDLDAAAKTWRNCLHAKEATPWLNANLASVLLADDGARLGQDDLLADSAVSELLRGVAAAEPALAEQAVKVLDRAAREAAAAGDWHAAAVRWDRARDLVGEASGLGSARRFHHNSAIAFEKQESWRDAANAWRALLRTRPRAGKARPAAADADYTEAQWRWIRDRVFRCYKRAGEPGEAVTLYRQALKQEPQDVELRMDLAMALLANEQYQAATNELQRILEIDPQHVEARLELGTLALDDFDYPRALAMLHSALELAPDRQDVRESLALALRSQGRSFQQAGRYDQAITCFAEGERLFPSDWEFPIDLARTYFDKHKPGPAQEHLRHAAALAGTQPQGHMDVITTWATVGLFDEARAALARAEALPGLPANFHLDVAKLLLTLQKKTQLFALRSRAKGSPEAEQLVDLAVEIVRRGQPWNAGNAAYYERAARALMFERPAAAIELAQEAVRLAPSLPDALVTLGVAQGLDAKLSDAEQALRAADRLARKLGQPDLAGTANWLIPLVRKGATSLREELSLALAFESLKDLSDAFDDGSPDLFE